MIPYVVQSIIVSSISGTWPSNLLTPKIFVNFYNRVEYIQLAAEHKPLNLGQGFPDFAAPEYVTKALAEATTGSNVLINQYTRGFVS